MNSFIKLSLLTLSLMLFSSASWSVTCKKKLGGNANAFVAIPFPISATGKTDITKSELNVLFGIRDRIKEYSLYGQIKTQAEADLINEVAGTQFYVGQAFTAKTYEEQVLLPAFSRLAQSFAMKKMRRLGGVAPKEDLWQAAMLGLITAIREYEVTNEYMFSRLVHSKVNEEMAQTLGDLHQGAAMTRGIFAEYSKVLAIRNALTIKLKREPVVEEIIDEHTRQKAHRFLVKKLQREPTRREIADALMSMDHISNLTVSSVEDFLSWHEFTKKIEPEEVIVTTNPHDKQDEIFKARDLIPDLGATPEDILSFKQAEDRLARLLIKESRSHTDDGNSERRLNTFSQYYGIHPQLGRDGKYFLAVGRARTFEAIGDDGGVAREQIREVVDTVKRRTVNAIKRLRDPDLLQFFETLLELRIQFKE